MGKEDATQVIATVEELEIIRTEPYPIVIPDDGYADGGEPYTNEELDIINSQ